MSQRKLQQEMDKVFKKIAEGLEVFNVLYERHESSSTTSQKDKLESDLKKEIKKLQRFREQVKTWQATNEVKDKEKLNENRRLVEQAMEKYKVVEKGSKTKAFSDQSLANFDSNRQENEATEFIRNCLEEIVQQEEALEAEMEKLMTNKKNKRLNSYANEERKAEVEELLQTHVWHTEKLEVILRLLENDILKSDDVMSIQDDIRYYVDENQSPDFINDETIYDELNLDADDSFVGEVHATLASHTKDDDITSTTNSSNNTPVKPKKKEPSPTPPTLSNPTSDSLTSKLNSTASNGTGLNRTVSGTNNINNNNNATSSVNPTTPLPYSAIGSNSSVPTMTTLKPAPVPVKPELRWSAAVAASPASTAPIPTSIQPATPASAAAASLTSEPITRLAPPGLIPSQSEGLSHTIPTNTTDLVNSITNENGHANGLSTSTTSTSTSSTSLNTNALNAASVLEALKKQRPQQQQQQQDGSITTTSPTATTTPRSSTKTPSVENSLSTSVTPLSTTITPQVKVLSKGESDVQKDSDFQFLPPGIQSMILSFTIARNRNETDRIPSLSNIGSMISVPRNFSPLSDSIYPPGLEAQRISTIWNSIRMSKNLEIEAQNVDPATLFYAYYFALSQKERDVASSILSSRQWRMNTERTSWFQRQSQVKVNGDGFEISDFSVFDAKRWTISEKRNFKLEYSQFFPIS
ncbi:hypothetical protein CANARDRAFT_173596 [[Candida] arabinofermentans NRRL YB-2248]|uniref:General negative regulator of transcription subunit n=1 Tax=[Candida] arabinofermentans NRRL YB-2248 TaxID=983967 RepID=A0A1E4T7D7_9ASCO|nr:hypothetical protein CANARDRAFT_173596 [[Candida] arabinofermentans NRRL YB-2248]